MSPWLDDSYMILVHPQSHFKITILNKLVTCFFTQQNWMAVRIEHSKIETAHNQSCLGEFEFMKAISTLFIGKVNEIQFQYLTQGQYLR